MLALLFYLVIIICVIGGMIESLGWGLTIFIIVILILYNIYTDKRKNHL